MKPLDVFLACLLANAVTFALVAALYGLFVWAVL